MAWNPAQWLREINLRGSHGPRDALPRLAMRSRLAIRSREAPEYALLRF